MSPHAKLIVIVAVVLVVPSVAGGCLWDRDTRRQERSRFPDTVELVTGKFLRHSKEFYEWRIRDRIAKLAMDPSNLAFHDDLAVAYEKAGHHSKAIETILAKDKLSPGLYETYSNLGTFHILAGDFELGLPYIDKALNINPDAHFGRERYQKWLVEYAIERSKGGQLVFPMRAAFGRAKWGFGSFLEERTGKRMESTSDFQPAIKGVLGMMRFANHANPLLLEALGDLLQDSGKGSALAVRCYLKASYEVKNPDAKERYRELASASRPISTGLEAIENTFAIELVEAEKWYAELRAKELKWIHDEVDVEMEFDRLYVDEPKVEGEIPEQERKHKAWHDEEVERLTKAYWARNKHLLEPGDEGASVQTIAGIVVVVISFILAGWLFYVWQKRRGGRIAA